MGKAFNRFGIIGGAIFLALLLIGLVTLTWKALAHQCPTCWGSGTIGGGMVFQVRESYSANEPVGPITHVPVRTCPTCHGTGVVFGLTY